MRALAAALAATASAFCAPHVAAQCPAPVEDPFVRSFPADGATGAARDGALLLTYDPPSLPDLQAGSCSAITADDIHVVEAGSGTRVSGTLVPWADNCAAMPVFAWRSDGLLAANQEYQVDVAFQDRNATSPQTWSSSFTTGDSTLPALSTSADVVATLGELEVVSVAYACMQPAMCGGGGGCIIEDRTVLQARVNGLDSIRGGQSDSGYAVTATLTADTPASFSGPGRSDISSGSTAYKDEQLAYLELGAPGSLVVRIPETDEPHVPCVAVNIWDAAGNSLQPTPTCFESLRVNDDNAGGAGAGGAAGEGGSAGAGASSSPGGSDNRGGDSGSYAGSSSGVAGMANGGSSGSNTGASSGIAGVHNGGSGGSATAASSGVAGVDNGGSFSADTGGSGGSGARDTEAAGASQSDRSDAEDGATSEDDTGDDGGCGCRAAPSDHRTPWAALIGALLGILALQRRRTCCATPPDARTLPTPRAGLR